jgi:hypothetical protein
MQLARGLRAAQEELGQDGLLRQRKGVFLVQPVQIAPPFRERFW